MPAKFQFKPSYTVQDLVEIMRILRAPGGCPWDAEQTHESIRKNLIEETYEAVEAINQNDPYMMCEEFGDVLMQVVFHSQIACEQEEFDFDQVADGVCKKLIERHPHVFGDVQVADSGEVLRNWDDIKRKSKGHKTSSQAMDSVPRELPALMRAQKIQQKAAKSGFDWDDIHGALLKIEEEKAELLMCIEQGDAAGAQMELGDLLFSAVNTARFLGCDAEECLTASTDKFIRRYKQVEAMAAQRGVAMQTASLEALDRLWDEAKQTESK